jgi:hypothetical protein
MLDDHARRQLCFIISQYGRTIIDDQRRCRGLLKDLAPNHKRETNLLFQTLDEKIAAELSQNNTIIPLPLQLDHLAQRLHDNCGIQLEFAYWSVESWAIALNVIQQPVPKVAITPKTITPSPKVVTSTVKQNEITAYKLGDVMPDGSIVFHVGASGIHGLAAKAADEDNELNWDEAKYACSAYGSDWRLPTKDELDLLYKQKSVVGGFAKSCYWSSKEYYSNKSNKAWFQLFSGATKGPQSAISKNRTNRVRAVRAFNQQTIPKIAVAPVPITPPPKVVKSTVKKNGITTYKVGDVLPDGSIVFRVATTQRRGLAVKAEDEVNELNWCEAKQACSAYGSGWRLPTKDELNLLYQQKSVVGGFFSLNYWSSTEVDSYYAWLQLFDYDTRLNLTKNCMLPVRAVRTF